MQDQGWRDWLKPILTSGAFWGLILGFAGWAVQTYTALPAPVWAFLDSMAALVLASWGVVVVRQQVKAVRAARAKLNYDRLLGRSIE